MEPAALSTHGPEEDADSDESREEEWSMYEDALEGAVADETAVARKHVVRYTK